MVKTNDFQKHIDSARERKKNEDLANRILGKKNRRQSAPGNLKPTVGASLASRVGVKKNRVSLGPATRQVKRETGDVNGEWTHDLHGTVSHQKPSLATRISGPAANTANSKKKVAARRAAALDRMDIDSPQLRQQSNIIPPRAPRTTTPNISIRGLAGPFTVLAQNFAPGTTAADIESAMTPIGGEMESCRILKTQPFIVVEMVFASREGGEAVIDMFNDKTADGRMLKVYPKIGGTKASSAPRDAPTGPRAMANDQVVDGTMGFPEPDERLYSDRMVGRDSRNGFDNRRGREGQGYRGRGRR